MKDFDEKEKTNEPYEDFKDLFPEKALEEQQKEQENAFRKKMLPRYIISLPVYFIGQIILSTIIVVLLMLVPNTMVKVSPEESVIIDVVTDSDGIAFIKKEVYNNFSDKYGKYLETANFNLEYLAIVNAYNYDVFKKDWLIEDENQNLIVNPEVMMEFINGNRTKWDEKRLINLYITSEEYGARLAWIPDYSKLNYTEHSKPTDDLSPGAKNVSQFLIYVALTLAIVPLLLPNLKEDFKAFKNKDTTVMIGVLAGFGFMFGAAIAANAVQNLLGLIFQIPGGEAINQLSIELLLKSPGAPLMILSSIILAPIVEELIFRKVIFELARNKWVALSISSLAFGLVHVSNELFSLTGFGHFLYVFVPYLLLGAGFSATYIVYKRNVITTIGAHMLWNIFAVVASFLQI